MLFYTENVLKFAFSIETSNIDVESSNPNNKKRFGLFRSAI